MSDTLTDAAGVTLADLDPPWVRLPERRLGLSVRLTTPAVLPVRVHAPVHFDCTIPEMRSLAHHEAGHAVVALSLGVTVFYATTIPRYDCLGHVKHESRPGMTLETGLLITLAGPAAQRRYFPFLRRFDEDLEDCLGGFDTDHARSLLRVLHGADHVSADRVELSRWRARADQMVTHQWPWIAAVARVLEQRQRLSGDEIARLNPFERKPSA